MPEPITYPSLANLLPADQLPEWLGFLEQGLSQVFYKNLKVDSSPDGSAATYSLDLVLHARAGITLGGDSGLALLLNPSADGQATELAVTLAWRWWVRRLIRGFEAEASELTPEFVFRTLALALEPQKGELLSAAATLFETGAEPLAAFRAGFNARHPGTPLTMPAGPPAQAAEGLVDQLEAAGLELLTVLWTDYLSAPTVPSEAADGAPEGVPAIDRTLRLLGVWIGTLTWDEALRLFLPQASVRLEDLRLALLLPPGLLRRVDPATRKVLTDASGAPQRAQLSFTAGSVEFSTETGLRFERQGDFDLTPAMIGDTGIIVTVEELEVDLSTTTNIEAASADGRDASFVGISARTASVLLPSFLEPDTTKAATAAITATDLVIGTGGFSGTLALTAMAPEPLPEGAPPPVLPLKIPGGVTVGLRRFDVEFARNRIIGSALEGSLSLPMLKDGKGGPAELAFAGAYEERGFWLRAEEKEGLRLDLAGLLTLALYKLGLGQRAGEWFVELTADLTPKLDVPLLGRVLPERIRIKSLRVTPQGPEDASLEVTWPGVEGLQVSAGDGTFNLSVPVNKSILGAARLDNASMTLRRGAGGKGVEVTQLLGGSLGFGPFQATFTDIGVRALLTLEPERGHVGPLRMDVAFVPPKGIGLAVDAGVVKGGGYLFLDPDKGEYAGVLELTLKETIAVKAVGILNTVMPDGSKGYSLVLIVSAEFTPLQLGFGFTLNGVGGIIGAQRTLDVDVLRGGLKAGTLGSVLFPKEPSKNAARIIGDLKRVFPIQKDRYVFGPMAIIGWGTPTLIKLEAGLLLELPEPVRLALVGILSCVLPDEEHAVVNLKVAFLGAIDFEKGRLSFDASLFDSRILTWALSGDMAVRLSWGEQPGFLLSVGGFHPAFEPPPMQLPSLERITLNLLTGDNPRLTLKAYLAITSNTAQLGARAELYVKVVGKLRVEGHVGFDALFRFSPFSFSVDVSASLAVLYGNEALMSVYFGGLLEGPSPWHVQGRAEFKVLCIKHKVRIDKTFGERKSTTLPDVAVQERLRQALADGRNWSATVNGAARRRVNLRAVQLASGQLLADPFGQVGVTQKVVPLEVAIDRFGSQKPLDAVKRWSVTLHDAAGTALATQATHEDFAPGQYFERDADSRLKGRSFERMKAGARGAAGQKPASGTFVSREVAYEVTVVEGASRAPLSRKVLAATFESLSAGSAAARLPQAVKQRLRSLGGAKVPPLTERYAVVSRDDLSAFGNLTAGSQAEAARLLDEAVRSNPLLKNSLQVVPAHEVARP
ncbi:hypothetical protein P2318_17900 [Myxococcaceae bacterium GXIMD 01537]